MTIFRYAVFFLLGLLAIAISYRQFAFSGPVTPPRPLPPHSIIDMHVHVAGLGYQSDCFISKKMAQGFKFDFYLRAFGVNRQQLKQHGDQYIVEKIAELITQSVHVDGAVILALDGVVDKNGQLDKNKTQVYISNNFVAKQTAQYPFLFFGASINPYRADAIKRLHQVKRQGAVLIKWIPNIQHINPADPTLIPFYQTLRKLQLPLLTHTGQERSFSQAEDQFGDPQRLHLPLSLGVTVIAAHIATTGTSAGQSNYRRILPMFARYPNLYADISSLTQINKLGYLNQALLDERLKSRLLYGSDFPLINTPLVSPWYFPLNLQIREMWKIAKIDNPFDRDVVLKQALGVTPDIFLRSRHILRLYSKLNLKPR